MLLQRYEIYFYLPRKNTKKQTLYNPDNQQYNPIE